MNRPAGIYEKEIEYIMRYYSFVHNSLWRGTSPFIPSFSITMYNTIEHYVKYSYWFRKVV